MRERGKRDSNRQRDINYSYFLGMYLEDATTYSKLETANVGCFWPQVYFQSGFYFSDTKFTLKYFE